MHRRRQSPNKPPSPGYPIGQVAREVHLSQKTLRDYERAGLIRPKRELRTNNRIYSDFEIEQIRQISRLIHKEGLTLPGIRRILQLAPCWNVFDCEEKEHCPAYQFPHQPCYQTRRDFGTLCDGSCEQCGVFLTRASKTKKVLTKPRSKGVSAAHG